MKLQQPREIEIQPTIPRLRKRYVKTGMQHKILIWVCYLQFTTCSGTPSRTLNYLMPDLRDTWTRSDIENCQVFVEHLEAFLLQTPTTWSCDLSSRHHCFTIIGTENKVNLVNNNNNNNPVLPEADLTTGSCFPFF